MASRDDTIEAIKSYPNYERDYHKRELESKHPFDAYSDENIDDVCINCDDVMRTILF